MLGWLWVCGIADLFPMRTTEFAMLLCTSSFVCLASVLFFVPAILPGNYKKDSKMYQPSTADSVCIQGFLAAVMNVRWTLDSELRRGPKNQINA